MGYANRIIVGFLLGCVAQLACSERDEAPDEPDRDALCSKHCEQIFGPCNPDPPSNNPGGPQTEAECNTNCVADVAWEGTCRFKYGEKMECSTSLDCEEFRVHQTDVLADPCLETENAWSSCL